MKLKDMLDKVDRLKPNNMDTQDKIDFVNELDEKVHNEIFLRAADYDGEFIKHEEDIDSELLVSSPYDVIYLYYLSAQVDYQNSEIASYNNNIALYNSEYKDFAAFYRRNHRPR